MKSSTLACGSPGRRRQRRILNPIMPILPITAVRFSHSAHHHQQDRNVNHTLIIIKTVTVFTTSCPPSHGLAGPTLEPPVSSHPAPDRLSRFV